jgi:4-amino-4-deoxy-L-arabinose transferase-like glycosyltransferase
MHGGRRLGSVPAYAAVAAAAVGGAALRLPFLRSAPYPDEGGLLVVARQWQAHGPYLYGSLFVDRPPLLLLFFRLAADLGGIVPVRVLGLLLVVGTVVCAGSAGHALGGRRGAACAALVAASLLANPRLGTREVDAETVGVPLVMLAAALALRGRSAQGRGRLLLLLAAGAAGAGAVLVKQNLADGLVFAVVLAAADAKARWVGVRRTAGAVLGGAGLPLAAAVVWSAVAATGPGDLWYSTYGFRLAGIRALLAQPSGIRWGRLSELGWAALGSGLVLLLVVSLVVLVRRDRDPPSTALQAMLVTELVGMAAGGYFWTHYLVGLVPATSLLVARAAALTTRPLVVVAAVAATLVSGVVATAVVVTHPAPYGRTEVGALTRWFEEVQRPGDSAVVLFGEAAMFETTRLRPAYPFLWTLPLRVLDPRVDLLVATLEEPRGPTYVVVRSSLDAWGLDPAGRLPRALHAHYRPVAHVCGSVVYLRRGIERRVPPSAGCG